MNGRMRWLDLATFNDDRYYEHYPCFLHDVIALGLSISVVTRDILFCLFLSATSILLFKKSVQNILPASELMYIPSDLTLLKKISKLAYLYHYYYYHFYFYKVCQIQVT